MRVKEQMEQVSECERTREVDKHGSTHDSDTLNFVTAALKNKLQPKRQTKL